MRQLTRQEIYDHLLQEGYVPVTELGDKWDISYAMDMQWLVKKKHDTFRIFVDIESMYLFLFDEHNWDCFTSKSIKNVVTDGENVYKLIWLDQSVENIYVDKDGVVFKKNKLSSVFSEGVACSLCLS